MKKKIVLTAVIILTIFAFSGCNKEETEASPLTQKFDKDASYALGMAYGSDIKNNIDSSGFVPDYDELIKGFSESLKGGKTRFDMYQAMEKLEAAFTSMTEERNAGLAQNENSFLAQNSQKPGVIITSSGLQYEVIREGTGAKPSETDIVRVHYSGTFTDGTLFDSSYERGAPAEFRLNEVIPGWTEGLQLMSVGGKYIFYIPSNIGYGNDGLIDPRTGTPIIPPYSVLIFDVELLDVVK